MRIFIAAGGSGGHLFPAVRFAEEIRKRRNDEVIFITSLRRQDRDILAQKAFLFKTLPVIGLKSKNPFYLFEFVFYLCIAMIKSLYLLLRLRPKVVLGFGGYVSWPVVFLAVLFRIKTIIHEQNVCPGKANKLLAKFADRIAVNFPESIRYLKGVERKVIVSGNPLRSGLRRSLNTGDRWTILAMGGSQGAHIINKLVPEAVSIMREDKKRLIDIIHLAGDLEKGDVERAYNDNGIKSTVITFTQDMAGLYNKSDFVISRAGATTVSELLYSAKPSILIPYPHADNHQALNAQVLVDYGAAVLLEEKNLDAEKLRDAIIRFMDRKILKDMFENLKDKEYNDACEVLIREVHALL